MSPLTGKDGRLRGNRKSPPQMPAPAKPLKSQGTVNAGAICTPRGPAKPAAPKSQTMTPFARPPKVG